MKPHRIIIAGITIMIAGMIMMITGQVSAHATGGTQLTVTTYNVYKHSADASTYTDLTRLLGQSDVVVVQEAAGKKAVLAHLARDGYRYELGGTYGGEDIIWNPHALTERAHGDKLVMPSTYVGPLGKSGNVMPAKELAWVRFLIPNGRRIVVADTHVIPSVHIDAIRHRLAAEHIRNVATWASHRINPAFIGGDWNCEQSDSLFDPMRAVQFTNDHAVLGTLRTHDRRAIDMVWFPAHYHLGVEPLSHRTVAGASDHKADVVSFNVWPSS